MIGFATEKEKKIIHKEVMPEIEWIPSYKFNGSLVVKLLYIPLLPILFYSVASWCVGIYSFLFNMDPDWEFTIPIMIFGPIFSWLIIHIIRTDKNSFHDHYDEYENTAGTIRIATKNGRYGLCRIKYWKELLAPKYITIIRNKNMYKICDDNGRWGVYNADYKKVIISCSYDRIEFDQYLSNIKAYHGDEFHLYAANGSRKS